jgi:hypothetical protein
MRFHSMAVKETSTIDPKRIETLSSVKKYKAKTESNTTVVSNKIA